MSTIIPTGLYEVNENFAPHENPFVSGYFGKRRCGRAGRRRPRYRPSGATRDTLTGELIGAAQQDDSPLEVLVVAQRQGDPAAVGAHVVRLYLMRRDELVAQALGKRNVDQLIAVDVADFPLAEAPLGAAKAMHPGANPGPAANHDIDLLLCP